MATTALTTASTLESLIGGLRSHLLTHTLPVPVVVTFYPTTSEISVQPEGTLDLASKLGNVLIWAHTLADVTATWQRTADNRLHVSVRGRSSGGAHIHVYGGEKFSPCLGLVPLGLGQSEEVSLDQLRTLVGLLREAQNDKKGAA
jgi:hypothetical protein